MGDSHSFWDNTLTGYDSEKEMAVCANQYIVLSSHGQHEPWMPVLRGLRDIRQFVHNSLSRGFARRIEPEPSQTDDIYLSHRVFNKVWRVSFRENLFILFSADQG